MTPHGCGAPTVDPTNVAVHRAWGSACCSRGVVVVSGGPLVVGPKGSRARQPPSGWAGVQSAAVAGAHGARPPAGPDTAGDNDDRRTPNPPHNHQQDHQTPPATTTTAAHQTRGATSGRVAGHRWRVHPTPRQTRRPRRGESSSTPTAIAQIRRRPPHAEPVRTTTAVAQRRRRRRAACRLPSPSVTNPNRSQISTS